MSDDDVLNCKLRSTSAFKKLVLSLRDISNQAVWEIYNDNIQVQTMDDANVALVHASLVAESFQEYSCINNENTTVSLDNLIKMLNRAQSDDTISITIPHAKERMDIFIEPSEKSKSQTYSHMTLNLLDGDPERVELPECDEYAVAFEISAEVFGDLCEKFCAFGETLSIGVDKKGVKFEVSDYHNESKVEAGAVIVNFRSGSDKKSTKKLKSADDDENPAKRQKKEAPKAELTQFKEPIQQRFGLHYMKAFARARRLGNTVTVRMASEAPVKLTYDCDGLGRIDFLLAPKY